MITEKFSLDKSLFALFLLLFISLFPTATTRLLAQEPTPKLEFSSVEQRRLINAVREERAKVEEERKELEIDKKELKTLEEGVDKKLAEIDAKLEELKNLQVKISSLLAEKTEEEKKRTQDLAKIYEKMSPAKAALSLSGLEKQLASDLLANMKVKAAAKILDQMPKQKATELSTTFSIIQLE